MHYAVPQFIEVEDKIIGPMTMKQFLWLLLGGGIVFILYFLLQFGIWIAVSLIIGSVFAAMAFIPIYGMTLSSFIMSFLRFSLMPQIFLWHKKAEGPLKDVPERAIFEDQFQAPPPRRSKPDTGRIRRLAWQLNVRGSTDEE